MNLSALSQIEENIYQLSLAEQLWLIERVAQRIREKLVAQSALDQQLAAMAADQEEGRGRRRPPKPGQLPAQVGPERPHDRADAEGGGLEAGSELRSM